MKYRKKPVVIEAYQWKKHDDLICVDILDLHDHQLCEHCGKEKSEHGWISTLEGGHIVCPNDWIITGIKGEKYPVKPDIFEATYDEVKNLGIPDLNKQPISHVDATPNTDYPLRILRAYRENCNCKWSSSCEDYNVESSPLLVEMNKSQDKRAEILDRAIKILEKEMWQI